MDKNSKLNLITDPIELEAEYGWMNLNSEIFKDESLLRDNVFMNRTLEDKENPHLFMLRIFRNPDNFYLTCKYFLNQNIFPFQALVLKEMWQRKFPMLIGTRGFSKSYLLSVYSILRALLCQGSKVVVVGAAFRQSKHLFAYCETIWNSSPFLREFVRGHPVDNQGPRAGNDRCVFRIGDSTITFLPIGNGDKIRGERATHLIIDEFSSVGEAVYETVLSGFTAVAGNPFETAKKSAKERVYKKHGLLTEEDLIAAKSNKMGNQSILSGTADYSFKHFAKYWKNYKRIIESKGDMNVLKDMIGDDVNKAFNWKDYSIIRVPADLLPQDFMDERSIARSRANMHNSLFQMEYGAIFPDDSQGFFKRTLIESCVANQDIITVGGDLIAPYSASLRGNYKSEYVYGVDPASEKDNLALTIIESNPKYRKVVFCWTINRKSFQEKIKAGESGEQDYYGYCARKILDCMKVFPAKAIGIDAQGGGYALMEALHDENRLLKDEVPIWPIIEEGVDKYSDRMKGVHIIHEIQFSRAEWVSSANHGMKKDFEDKKLVFPGYSAIDLEIAHNEDLVTKRKYDTLEDCILEIEELKNELSSIIHSATGVAGRDRWDTPEIKEPGSNKKGRLRKDRYSSLLIANGVARNISDEETRPDGNQFSAAGGFAGRNSFRLDDEESNLMPMPSWLNTGWDRD